MAIDYLVDTKKESNRSSYILDISNLDNLDELELSFSVIKNEINQSIEKKDFKKCYKLLNNAKLISDGSDLYFLLELIVKLEECMYEFDKINLDDSIKLLKWKYKVLELKRDLRVNRTAKLSVEHKGLVKKLYELDDEMKFSEVLGSLKNKVLKNKNIDFEVLTIFRKHKDLEGVFYKYLLTEIDKSINLNEKKGLFKRLYSEDFLASKEFESAFNKFENCEQLLDKTDKAYLLYKFNQEKNIISKIRILENFEILNSFRLMNSVNKFYIAKKLIFSKSATEDIEVFIERGRGISSELLKKKSNNNFPII